MRNTSKDNGYSMASTSKSLAYNRNQPLLTTDLGSSFQKISDELPTSSSNAVEYDLHYRLRTWDRTELSTDTKAPSVSQSLEDNPKTSTSHVFVQQSCRETIPKTHLRILHPHADRAGDPDLHQILLLLPTDKLGSRRRLKIHLTTRFQTTPSLTIPAKALPQTQELALAPPLPTRRMTTSTDSDAFEIGARRATRKTQTANSRPRLVRHQSRYPRLLRPWKRLKTPSTAMYLPTKT